VVPSSVQVVLRSLGHCMGGQMVLGHESPAESCLAVVFVVVFVFW